MDAGFGLESKTFPRLVEAGGDSGLFQTIIDEKE
jgi:hypothetical protein